VAEGRGSRYLLVMSVGAIGVVYGDIGTSPLYAFRESFVAADGLAVTRDSVLGVLSLMFWALVLVVSLKYLALVMRADNDGEGGILALTALIAPNHQMTAKGLRWGLILLGLFGTALLYGDGMITPAISVLSAVEGLEVAAPSLDAFVVPIAIVILIGLFAIQHHGTGKVGVVFGPVMLVWFSVLAILGISHIEDQPGVLAALNPWHALQFATGQPKFAFLALGAIFLVVTGSEALYADMGHFGKSPIRLGWFTLVFPALLLNYFGQGALLLKDPAAVENPFYRMSPDWALYPMVILATAATVIASQALISGAFSLTMQAAQLGYLPRIHVDHTSPRTIGQVYISSVNWLLMIACVALVVSFGSSTNLAAAYGVAVTTTMVITTLLMFIVMRETWHWKLPAALAFTTLFLVVDLSFFAANIIKVPAGGWVPLLVGAIVFTLMTTWKRGRSLMTTRIHRGELPIERFIGSITEHPQQRVPGTAVYLFPDPGATPSAMLANLRHNGVLHETLAIVSVRAVGIPRVPQAGRTTVHNLGEGFYQIELRYGFFEQPDVPAALEAIVATDFGFDRTDATYVLGMERVIATDRPGMALWRDHLFAFLHRNSSSAVQYFRLPAPQVIEVGTQVEI
jgi:KUP system potassium uptake protein